jgi:hypothetical protein
MTPIPTSNNSILWHSQGTNIQYTGYIQFVMHESIDLIDGPQQRLNIIATSANDLHLQPPQISSQLTLLWSPQDLQKSWIQRLHGSTQT